MKVLIACEFSGIVRDKFLYLGHNAISVDFLETEKPGPHIIGDCFKAIKSFKPHLIIAHPPCTYLCNSGVRWLWNRDGSKNEERWRKMVAAAKFFKKFLHIPNTKVAVENPKLEKTNVVDRGMIYVDPRGKKHGGVHTMRAKISYSPLMLLPKTEERWKIRSRTFPGFATAMAQQWGEK